MAKTDNIFGADSGKDFTSGLVNHCFAAIEVGLKPFAFKETSHGFHNIEMWTIRGWKKI